MATLIQTGIDNATSPPNQAHAFFSTPTTPGSLLVAVVSCNGSVSASAPPGWTQAVANTSGAVTVAIFYLSNAPSMTIVASNLSGDCSWLCSLSEWSGIDSTSDPLDHTSSSGGSNGTGSITTTQSDILIVGGIATPNPSDYPFAQNAYPIIQRATKTGIAGATLGAPTSSPGTYSDDTTPPGVGCQVSFRSLPSNVIKLNTIPSTLTMGSLTLANPSNTIALNTIASTLTMGTLSVRDPASVISLATIPSTLTMGTLTLSGGSSTISLATIPSTLTMGTLTLSQGPTFYQRTITIPSGTVSEDLRDFLLSVRCQVGLGHYTSTVQAYDEDGTPLPTHLLRGNDVYVDVVVKVPMIYAATDTTFNLEYS